MSYTTPGSGTGASWPAGPSDTPSPPGGVPAAAPARRPPGRSRGLVFAVAVAGALAALAVVLVVVSSRGGDGQGDRGDGGGLGGAAAGTVPGGSSVPSNAGTVAPTTTTGAGDGGDGSDGGEGAPAGAGLPAVTIPGESTPPTTIPGSEPNSIPVDIFSGEEAPQFGTLVVDVEEGGFADFAVHLRSDQEIQLLSLADDGIGTEIEVYAPDGSKEGWWKGGEPGVINGLEWYLPDEPLPATGTYVIRAIHTGGSHEPFVLGFFGNA
jgi:hypothetical protein